MSPSEPPIVLVVAGHPADIGWEALGPAIGCMCLALVAVCARWYARCSITRVIGLDDYMIIFSVILSVALTGIVAEEVQLGIGQSQWAQTHSKIPTTSKLIIAGNVIYQILVNITKASIVVQYLRIFAGTPTIAFRRTCQGVLIILTLVPIWEVFGCIFLCVPVSKMWNPNVPGKCINPLVYWYTTAPVNVVLDFVVWLLPMPLVSQLHLPHRQKVGLMVLFTLGGLVCIIGILRIVMVHVAASIWHDLTRSGLAALTWAIVEANVGISCACLLSIKPLISKVCPHLLESDSTPAHSMRLRKISFWGQPLSETTTRSTNSQTCVDSRRSTVAKPAKSKRSWSSNKSHSNQTFKQMSWRHSDPLGEGRPDAA